MTASFNTQPVFSHLPTSEAGAQSPARRPRNSAQNPNQDAARPAQTLGRHQGIQGQCTLVEDFVGEFEKALTCSKRFPKGEWKLFEGKNPLRQHLLRTLLLVHKSARASTYCCQGRSFLSFSLVRRHVV